MREESPTRNLFLAYAPSKGAYKKKKEGFFFRPLSCAFFFKHKKKATPQR